MMDAWHHQPGHEHVSGLDSRRQNLVENLLGVLKKSIITGVDEQFVIWNLKCLV